MRNTVKAVCILAILTLAAGSSLAKTGGTTPADRHDSIVIVFKDGHRQNIDMADIARIEFKTPLMIVYKDGRQKNIPASDIARIEFESPLTASTPGRNHFLGKWKVGEGNGFQQFLYQARSRRRSHEVDWRGPWHLDRGRWRSAHYLGRWLA